MPYQTLLDRLMSSVDGVRGAVLLDSEGEVIVESGARDFRHRLIGAYQGLALAAARQTLGAYGVGDGIRHLLCRYEGGTVIVRPMRDGYYFIVSLEPDVATGAALHMTARVQVQLDDVL
jgi:predicted regulator of Ras-like GTPase activity (Roadblock/LC7/MglB family)